MGRLGLALSAFALFNVADLAGARAQDGQKPTVSLSPVVLSEPEVETPLEIKVGPDTALPRQSFVRIRGLPAASKLSDGHVITPGAWAVPLAALKSLKVSTPVAGSGRTEITVSLVNLEGETLAETKASLVVAPAWLLGSAAAAAKQGDPLRAGTAVAAAPPPPPAPQPAPRPAPAAPPAQVAAVTPPPPPAPPPAAVTGPAMPAPSMAAAPPPPPPAAQAAPRPAQPAPPPQLSAADIERINKILAQGDNFKNQGNIAAARQFYRRAADMGSHLGAMRLAGTYDPSELAQMQTAGIQPDPAEARKWYQRARELGASDAEARMSRLQGR